MKLSKAFQGAALSALVIFSTVTHAQKEKENQGVVLALPVDAAPGKTTAEVRLGVQNIVAIIRKQPGLLDEHLLANNSPNASPGYVHVMRWGSLKQWETIFSSPDFQKAIRENSDSIQIKASAGIFKPIK